nr:HNH endonuclease [Comamonas thiooxydans]
MWERANQLAFARQYRLSSKQLALHQSTAEHLHARQDGGRDAEHNIAAACRFCNVNRHKGRTGNAPSPQQYKAHVQRRIAQGKWHPALALLLQGKAREYVASRHHQRMAAIKPPRPAAVMPSAAST